MHVQKRQIDSSKKTALLIRFEVSAHDIKVTEREPKEPPLITLHLRLQPKLRPLESREESYKEINTLESNW